VAAVNSRTPGGGERHAKSFPCWKERARDLPAAADPWKKAQNQKKRNRPADVYDPGSTMRTREKGMPKIT